MSSSLSIGIIGLPNVGKSTLFNALLKRQQALAANYPFATIEPNVGVVEVPDERLQKLKGIVKNEHGQRIGDREVPEKVIPAVVHFYDIAGLVKGASQGEGLGNQFLSHIREVDALIHVVRAFEDTNVVRADSKDPKSDIEIIDAELALADLQSLEKRIERFEVELKKARTADNLKKMNLYLQLKESLNRGVPARDMGLSEEDKLLLKDLNLLTQKPIIYVFNVNESVMSADSTHIANITNTGMDNDNLIYLSAKIESELSSLSESDAVLYKKELGLEESGLDQVIKSGYRILGLQTFFTAGPKEVRAWTIRKGFKAPQAAGTIHTDFERGFITAEVVSYQDLQDAGSWKSAKEKGLVRIEGKNYIMQDGDVVYFRFSV
jgi:ribosome-binding ATPase